MQDDLNKLLILVQKELKKKMFPRKHIKLLWRDVEIVVEELPTTIRGQYKTIKNNEDKYKYTHKIIIAEWAYNQFLTGEFGGWRPSKAWTRKKLKETIAHELLHAYVYEKFEYQDYMLHADGSPIFLSILAFFNLTSGHATSHSFQHTDLYKKVKEIDNFDKLETLLIHLTCEWEDKFRDLKFIQMEDEKRAYLNNFYFSSGKVTGLKSEGYMLLIESGILVKINSFSVGPNTNINNLRELVIKKAENNVFREQHSIKCSSLEDKRNKLKLQSMNA